MMVLLERRKAPNSWHNVVATHCSQAETQRKTGRLGMLLLGSKVRILPDNAAGTVDSTIHIS